MPPLSRRSPRGDQSALWLVPEAANHRGTLPALLAVVGQDGIARRITAVPVVPLPAAPVWSSRTDAFAYPNGPENIRDHESAAVYLRTADGRITMLPSADITSFSWSPDGAWVAYTRQQRLLSLLPPTPPAPIPWQTTVALPAGSRIDD